MKHYKYTKASKISMRLHKILNNPSKRPEVKKKMSLSLLGRKMPRNAVEKCRLAKLGKPRSLETRIKISSGLKNHPCYQNSERNKKISEAKLKNPTRYWLNKKRISMIGNKFSFLNGKSKEPYPNHWTETFKKSIRERDNYKCRICNSFGKYIHHIDYDKINCNPKNLLTLCHSCHSKTNSNREFWKGYFS